jgi:hypothetical protein
MKETKNSYVFRTDIETLFNDENYEDCPEIIQIKRFDRLDNVLHDVCGGACEGCDFDIEEEDGFHDCAILKKYRPQPLQKLLKEERKFFKDGFTKKQLLSFIKLLKATRKGNKTK